MSASEFCPHWSSISTSTVTQESEPTASRFHAHAGPFPQPVRNRHDSYRNFNDFAVNQHMVYAHSPGQLSMQLPNPYEQSHHQAFQYQPSYSGVYPHQAAQPPVPRRPAFSSNRPVDAHPEVTWFGGAGHMPTTPSHSMMRGPPGSPPLYPHGNEANLVSSQPLWPFIQEQGYGAMDQQLPMHYPPGHTFASTPPRATSDRSRQAQAIIRRSSQQGTRQYHGNSNSRPYDVAERRAFRSVHGPGRLPDGNDSPPASGRRTYDSFIQDMSRSITSSELDEGAARVPPSFRARRLPREHRLRHPVHSQHHDPNLATSRQVQDLKGKLPRRLPSQLPEGTSHTCDICAKDYSSTCVQPCEETEIAVELPCGHFFGEFCIFEWVRIAFSRNHV
jgi:hypothetical protein